MKFFYYFFLGIIAAFSALFLELFFLAIWGNPETASPYLLVRMDKLILAAILIEEFIKLIFIRQTIPKTRFRISALAAAWIFGLGFASVETFFNLRQSNGADLSMYLDLAGVVSLHILTAGFLGYFTIYWSRFGRPGALLGLALAVLIHFFYNYLVIYNLEFWAPFYLLVLFLIFFLFCLPAKSNGEVN